MHNKKVKVKMKQKEKEIENNKKYFLELTEILCGLAKDKEFFEEFLIIFSLLILR